MKNIIKSAVILALASAVFLGSAGPTFADEPESFRSPSGVTYNNCSGPDINLDNWETT